MNNVIKRIVEVIVRNRIAFNNICIVLVIVICGVTYCILGENNWFRGKVAYKGLNEEASLISLDDSETESWKHSANFDISSGDEVPTESQVFVYICGSVMSPGVYQCKDGTRLYELIDMAGGYSAIADRECLNLVDVVRDGQRIYVPYLGEAVSSGMLSGDGTTKVNINTADVNTLMTLPGIGETKAREIVAYRQEHGAFKEISDIMKVSGIKDAAYEKIKDYILV